MTKVTMFFAFKERLLSYKRKVNNFYIFSGKIFKA